MPPSQNLAQDESTLKSKDYAGRRFIHAHGFMRISYRNNLLRDTVFTLSVITAVSTLHSHTSKKPQEWQNYWFLQVRHNYFDAVACLRCDVTGSRSAPVCMWMAVKILAYLALLIFNITASVWERTRNPKNVYRKGTRQSFTWRQQRNKPSKRIYMKCSTSDYEQHKCSVINQSVRKFRDVPVFKVSVIKHGLVSILSHRRLRVIIY